MPGPAKIYIETKINSNFILLLFFFDQDTLINITWSVGSIVKHHFKITPGLEKTGYPDSGVPDFLELD